MHWLVDLDDTLVIGPNTWAFEVVLPDLIKKYELPYRKDRFDVVMLEAQKRSAIEADESKLLSYIFSELNWRNDIGDELIHRVFNEYTPQVFPDTLDFLSRLQDASQKVYLVSNNGYAQSIAEQLNIDAYFTAIYTPKDDILPKPNAHMWQQLHQDHVIDDLSAVRMVGDDPWTDGTFAERCGIKSWIVDRLGRYSTLGDSSFTSVNTLNQIVIN